MTAMKILIINGSTHKGNTWALTKLVKNQIKQLDSSVIFKEIHLSESNIEFCTGCSLCFREGNDFCPHNKAVQPIIDEIKWCDGLIFAASCFQGAVPAVTKNFTDHLAFLLHRPRFFYKKAMVISTTGGVLAGCTTKSLANTLYGWGFNKCYELPIRALSWNDYKPSESHIKKAHNLSKKFYYDIKLGKMHSPKIGVLIPFNLFQAISDNYAPGKKYETMDGVFWRRYKGKRYADNIPLPLYKSIFAKIIFILGKRFFSKIVITYKIE